MDRYRIVVRSYASGRRRFFIQTRRPWWPLWRDVTSRQTLDAAETTMNEFMRMDADEIVIGEMIVSEGPK